ncbi:hydrogenase maturation protease [Facilibium subflavum]|uniref:hydrogenase maturation protease n=1 Tax=Facilibium subflavum TaxID=2219058 RepID=UPI001F3A2C0A|nr:hydrogenase maturation protease [Facilibium subflavum]
MKTLVLGIGSPFADDQFGWKVAEELQNSVKDENIQVKIVDRPGLNLLRFIEQDFQKVMLVDAVNAKAPIGQHFTLSAGDIIDFHGFFSSHSIGIAPSLALAQALNYPINHIKFYGVQIKRITQKDDILSNEIKAQISPIACKIMKNLK